MSEKLPDTRASVTHKAEIQTAEGRIKFFFTVGFYEDGQRGMRRPGELFLHMDESGSTLDGFADCWAIAISMLLQTGTTLDQLVQKFAYQEFEPKGRTKDKGVSAARSVVDYVVRWMEQHVEQKEERRGFPTSPCKKEQQIASNDAR